MADSLENQQQQPLSADSEVLTALALRIAAGDSKAEGEFVKHTRFGLWMVLVKRGCSREEAEDLVQEALMVALRRLRAGEIDDPGRISGYLLRTALYMQRAGQRRLSESRTVYDAQSLELYADERADPLAELNREQREDMLRQSLNWLGQARDRELLRRHYLLEEDKSDVCERLGLSLEHFDRVLHRAKKRLAELMRSWR